MPRPKQTIQVQPLQKKWLSKEEAMKYLGCTDRFLRILRDNAQITFARYGNKMYWYELASIDKFLEKHIEGIGV